MGVTQRISGVFKSYPAADMPCCSCQHTMTLLYSCRGSAISGAHTNQDVQLALVVARCIV